jgi:hypothetical protein
MQETSRDHPLQQDHLLSNQAMRQILNRRIRIQMREELSITGKQALLREISTKSNTKETLLLLFRRRQRQ